MPATVQEVLDVFLEKFGEFAKRMTASQVEWQTKALANLREIYPPEAAHAVTDGARAEVIIDVDGAPEATDGRGRSQVRVSDFMRENWQDAWTSSGLKVKSYLLKYALLLKTRAAAKTPGPLNELIRIAREQ